MAEEAVETGRPSYEVGSHVWLTGSADQGKCYVVEGRSGIRGLTLSDKAQPSDVRTVSFDDVEVASTRLIENNSVADLLSSRIGDRDARYNVEHRLHEGQVFTYCGSSVLYARPTAASAPVGLFSAEVQQQFSTGTGHRDPHLYEVVNQAYLRTIRGSSDKSKKHAVVIHGAQGSGKSTLVREALSFILNRVPPPPAAASSSPLSLRDQVDAADEIVSAFVSTSTLWCNEMRSTRAAIVWKMFFQNNGAISGVKKRVRDMIHIMIDQGESNGAFYIKLTWGPRCIAWLPQPPDVYSKTCQVHVLPRVIEEGRLFWREENTSGQESNFRVLYLLVQGTTEEEDRKKWDLLPDIDHYRILRGSRLDTTVATEEHRHSKPFCYKPCMH